MTVLSAKPSTAESVNVDVADLPGTSARGAIASGKARPPALLVDRVSHSFGDAKVLQDVSLKVEEGTIKILLGLNGAGKSTLFALITRLYDNVTGEIAILGNDVRRRPIEALRHLGVVFQSRTLDLDLTLLQNLTYHASLHGLSNSEGRKRATAALERVGLGERASEKVRSLSGGQARRVEIARSLLHGPSLLLLDEPTVGLDIDSRENVMEIVRGLAAEQGLGVLWATHLIDEIRPEDEIVVLHRGKELFDGTVPQFLEATGTETVSDAFRKMTGEGAR